MAVSAFRRLLLIVGLLSLAFFAVTAGEAPLAAFDGKDKVEGSGWADPADTSLNPVADPAGGQVLEFRATWTNYWAGGGWNWRNWQEPGDDLTPYNALAFRVRCTAGAAEELWIQLADSARKTSLQVKLVEAGLLPALDGGFREVVVPLALFGNEYDRKNAAMFNFGLAPARQMGQATLQFSDIRFIDDPAVAAAGEGDPAPTGDGVDWNLADAWAQASDTDARVSLNAYWNFLPARDDASAERPPSGPWGWFKVPGIWPNPAGLRGLTPAQDVILPRGYPGTKQSIAATLDRAWYRRTLTVPEAWRGRAVRLDLGLVQTHAKVYLDGREAGEAVFPGGMVEITPQVKFGQLQELAILLTARPVDAGAGLFMAPDRVVEGGGTLAAKGLVDDVYLVSGPPRNAIDDLRVDTSVRRKEIAFQVGLAGMEVRRARFDAEVRKDGVTVKTFAFDPVDVPDAAAQVRLAAPWADPDLWDADTPENVYEATLSMRDADGRLLCQSLPQRFGFREFWIDGRDFRLNGSKVHLRAAQLANMGEYADTAGFDGAMRSMRRMKEYGFNFFIAANYGFQPGQVGYLNGTLEAADAAGILQAFSLPHVNDFGMKLDDPAVAERYRALCRFLVRRAQNHPSVVLYAMNHNAMGYAGDQNPSRLDGRYDPETARGAPESFLRIRRQGKIAEEIAASLDPSRPVYHHESGNFGTMHTVNIYLNWAPRQERSDWIEQWARNGAKPLFFVEWGMPHLASWTDYRGPQFLWTSELILQMMDSEYAAASLGDGAYAMTPAKVEMLEKERRLRAGGKPYWAEELTSMLQRVPETYNAVQAWHMAENWRAFRAWGLSAALPWDQVDFWKRVKPTPRVKNPARLERLRRPGLVPDLLGPNRQYLADTGDDTFEASPSGALLRQVNQPLLAFIGGHPGFTDKAHNFRPGETATKQLVVVNDTRRPQTCAYTWRAGEGGPAGEGRLEVPAGETRMADIAFAMPDTRQPVNLEVRSVFDGGETLADAFALHSVTTPETAAAAPVRVRLFDPKGHTAALFREAGIGFDAIRSADELAAGEVLVIGREALSAEPRWILPAAALARSGRVLVMEQDRETLANRLGFRVAEWGAREVFVRTPGHPALAGLSAAELANWRGASTLTEPYTPTDDFELQWPRAPWNGFENPRVWKAGHRNAVTTVMIEKPSVGVWLPLVDGGFDLQYTPLLEHVGRDFRAVFCQLDVSGRTESDPAASRLLRNLVDYLAAAPKPKARTVVYAGNPEGADLLTRLGHKPVAPSPETLRRPEETLLVLGPGHPRIDGLARRIDEGLHVVALGLSAGETAELPGAPKAVRREKSVSWYDPKLADEPRFAGLSNADTHWRDFPTLAAFEPDGGQRHPYLRTRTLGRGAITFVQAAPWHFDYNADPTVRTSYRRNLFLVSRLLANHEAVAGSAPLADFLGRPASVAWQSLASGWKGRAEEGPADLAAAVLPDHDDSGWPATPLPHMYPQLGYYWYRMAFEAAEGLPEDVTLSLGAVDDESWVWLNGKLLGEVTKANSPNDYWSKSRDYPLKRSDLKPGKNVVAVRVNNIFRDGGMVGRPALVAEGAWNQSFYLQKPIPDDDPYRYYRW